MEQSLLQPSTLNKRLEIKVRTNIRHIVTLLYRYTSDQSKTEVQLRSFYEMGSSTKKPLQPCARLPSDEPRINMEV